MKLDRMVCANAECGRVEINVSRGLCWRCYKDKRIRLRHPPLPARARNRNRRGVGNGNRSVLPDRPTPAAPGTPEKIAVLEQRAESGVSLHHPMDG